MTGDVPADLRVSDDERDAVAGELREHFAVGRLTLDELHERLDRAYTARTRSDLDAVTADLPGLASAAPPPAPRRWTGPVWGRYVRVNTICWSIWAVSAAAAPGHHWPGMWPLWVTVPWGVALLGRRHHHG